MINRRRFLNTGAVLGAGLFLTRWTTALAAHEPGRIICGTPGLVGKRLAQGMAIMVAADHDLDYGVETIDRDTNRDAVRKVRSAEADGTVLLQTHSGPLVLSPALYEHLDYSPLEDFKPIAFLGEFGFGFFVGPAVPTGVTNISQYLTWLRQNPDYRDVGFTQTGSHSHLLTMLLGRIKVAPTRPRAYQSTQGLLDDLRNKDIAAGVASVGSITQTSAQGIRLIAVTGNERDPMLDSVPTFTEQGLADMDLRGWFGWFAPAATDDAIVEELNARATALQSRQAYASLQRNLLLAPAALSPDEIRARMKDEVEVYRQMIATYGIPKLV